MKKNRNGSIILAQFYKDWLNECYLYKSENTIESYANTINIFLEYLGTNRKVQSGDFCAHDAFSATSIKEWLEWMSKKGIKPQSINVRLACIRSFLKYLSMRDAFYSSMFMAAKGIERLKTEHKQVCGMSKEAVKAILATPNVKTNTGYRDITLISLLYITGCRIDEILSIKLKDVYLESKHPFISILGKGQKRRSPFVPSIMVSNLKNYIRRFHGLNSDCERYLFFSCVKGVYCKITQETIRKRLKDYAIIAHKICSDVPLNLHAHLFRHSMSIHRLEDNMNVVQLSKELGHSNLSTTMLYLDIVPGQKERAIVEMESEDIRELPRKWKNKNNNLIDLFKR